MKPAGPYYIMQKVAGEVAKKIVYEHRDEGPIRELTCKGKKRFAYRRCYTGVILDGLPLIKEDEEKIPEKNYRNQATTTAAEE